MFSHFSNHSRPGEVWSAWHDIFESLMDDLDPKPNPPDSHPGDDLAPIRGIVDRVNRVQEAIDAFVVGPEA